MRLLWQGEWMRVPAPAATQSAVLLDVECAVSLGSIEEASGRTIRRPGRKVALFLLTDGPRATLRKVRTKRGLDRYLGDYRVLATMGTCRRSGRAMLALAPRSAPCAEILAVHEALCRPLPDGLDQERFERFAKALQDGYAELESLCRQTYLYSGTAPPGELTALVDGALRDADAGRPLGAPPRALRPERDDDPATVIEIGRARTGRAPVALLGAGDYARTEIVPSLRRAGLELSVLCDREPQIAAMAAAEAGFARAGTDAREAIDGLDRRGLVVVATNHDSHARLAAEALEAGHRVLLEKPAVVDSNDLERLRSAAARFPGELEVGFNRRYNPLVRRARRDLAARGGPLTLICSIREVEINPDHWYLWANQGTRVAGNLCHWIDLAVFLVGAGRRPLSVSISPKVVDGPRGFDAERTFSIDFDDGSVAVLVASGRGDDVRGVQEQVEVRRGGLTLTLDDLWRRRALEGGWMRRSRTLWRDKGHQRMYTEMLDRFRSGEPSAYPIDDLLSVSATQLAATELVLSGGSRLEIAAVSTVAGGG